MRPERALLALLVAAGLSCRKPPVIPPALTPPTYFLATTTDRRFYTAEHMLASIEMQISGEPFAQLLGRNLIGFDRFSRTTDLYLDPATGRTINDPLGYATAIESYEYSKQPMNNLSFESGAGLSLQFGPLENPARTVGDPAFVRLRDRLQHFADASHSGGAPGTNFVVSPAPTANPLNIYGWPGYWPVFAEFRSFDPAIEPSLGATRGCTVVGGYAAQAMGAQRVGDYECGYNSLNLPLREVQVEKVIEPAALGFALWKQGLWVINYWQSLHDLAGNGITAVAAGDLAQVGVPGNNVIGRYPDPADPTGKRMLDGVRGVYLGDIPLEGWQGLTMLDEMDNKAAFLLGSLTTVDGAHLSGFQSTKQAIDYHWQAPLSWWPHAVAVDETPTTADPDLSDKFFPQPTGLRVTDGGSRLTDLSALLGGFAEFFALTDGNNPDVGGGVAPRATFDGDPFAADNGLPDGEDTPHDRALAVLKVALVDVDRLHLDAAHAVLTDGAAVVGGKARPGTTVTTVAAAYAIVALRTALRALSSTLSLYSNDTPDTHGLPTALDGSKLTGAPAAIADRVVALIRLQADFLVAHLVAADGAVANSFDLAAQARDPSPTLLQSEASAIRGLLDAYLATSDERYRQAAIRVWADLDRRFFMHDVRAYRTTAGVDDPLTYSPLQFGALQGALRQYWKLVASRPGNERLASEIGERVKRANKLVANGWDDANGDDQIQFPDECTGAGLQMAERALTGELSVPADGPDRDRDCVREIGAAKRPAALAGQVVLKRR